MEKYDYIIVGGGLAGASAAQGIREIDSAGSILLVGQEKDPPYNRPPLSKDLWLGKKQVEEIFVHEKSFYSDNEVNLNLGTTITEVNPEDRIIRDGQGGAYAYGKLLLSTGGTPKKLDIPGGESEEINYYRSLGDFRRLRVREVEGDIISVIGGGFIGAEMAAALSSNGADVSMVFPEKYLLSRHFPEELGRAVQKKYQDKGVGILTQNVPQRFEQAEEGFEVETRERCCLQVDKIVAGIGITPSTKLAESADLNVSNGIEVNEYLQTSDPHIYAAGDNTLFPYQALGEKRRVEHWDNAKKQGRYAGRNMAGSEEQYNYLPYFYSDLFDFGFEAVGDVNPELEVIADWSEKHEKGVLYYLNEGNVRGVMLCGVWGKLGQARELIESKDRFKEEDLRGTIC